MRWGWLCNFQEAQIYSVHQEIERKFLLTHSGWRGLARGTRIRQGYLCLDPERTVRVRLAGSEAWLTIKGKSSGPSRLECNYAIPLAEAERLLDEVALRPLVEKVRYAIAYEGLIWEVDEFFGDNLGLVLAEVELESEDQAFERPDWIGEEVTDDPRYYNASLVLHPFCTWG
ncbi:CYTH domain-containing protein [Desulfovibrio sp. OttesenSCG-928-F20]|nr:CYTH domain-containing protein [Desulfovibrio sp. OttesenSCG-928-F20]